MSFLIGMFRWFLSLVLYALFLAFIYFVYLLFCKVYDFFYAKTRVKKADDRQMINDPKTIEDLWKLIDHYHVPLEKVRFFIEEDYQKPKAFGIYQDKQSGDWVVYKNKDTGERAIRYKGKDEAHAVHEIWAKLVVEAQNRGLGYLVGENDYVPSPNKAKGLLKIQQGNPRYVQKRSIFSGIITAIIAIAIVICSVFYFESHNGYYTHNNNIYYHQGFSWYHYDADIDYDSSDYGWVDYYGDTSDFEKVDRTDIDVGYDFYGFEYTDAYESYHESRSDSDSDWDSWDSGGTDWSSDW